MANFCSECGKPIARKFCSNCGTAQQAPFYKSTNTQPNYNQTIHDYSQQQNGEQSHGRDVHYKKRAFAY